MKLIRILLGTLMLFVLMGSTAIVSQEKNPSPTQHNYVYDQFNQETARGWVAEMKDFQCPVSGAMGSHIIIKNEIRSIEIHLAPTAFMKQFEINIRKGDNVTVVGSRIEFEGHTALIAKSVSIGRETYNFRDSQGRPLW
jgi:hypothetical protein